MTDPAPLRVARERRQADDWALVLVAVGLQPRIQRRDGQFELFVAAGEEEHAAWVLARYDAENTRPPEPPPDLPPAPGALEVALAVAAALVVFFVWSERSPDDPWLQAGRASSSRILAGEWWRAVTALTLHADLGHVLGNAVAGAFFFTAAGRVLGAGVALFAVVLAGAAGNGLNALYHGPGHFSVGASTSVFAAVGLLGGLAVSRQWRRGITGRRRLAPLAAALALVAMLGTGPRADIGAHLFGLLAGGVLGLAFAPWVPRTRGLPWQVAGGLLALAGVAGSWWRALA